MMVEEQDIQRLAPLPEDGTDRPLWSVMIPTYNCAALLAQTLQSVLEQDPGPRLMQIMVVDDASTDDPEAVVQQLGKGRVGFYRQEKNLRQVRNFETCLSLSRGHLVHLLHGDDRVCWGFYRHMADLMAQCPEAGAAFCRHYFIDEAGHQFYTSPLLQNTAGYLPDALPLLSASNKIQTPAMVVRRRVYEQIGMFDRHLNSAEDWEMWVRIAAHFPIAYQPLPLAEYRMLNQSHTIRTVVANKSLDDIKKVHERIRSHNGDGAAALVASHRANLAEGLWYDLRKMRELGHPAQARQLFWRSLGMPMSLRMRWRICKTMLGYQ